MRAGLFTILILLSVFESFGLVDTASNGNWTSTGIWQSGTSPANGDTLVIPAGVAVNVNCNCGTYASMYILVLGTINFPKGKKINMTANGRVDIFAGGRVTGGNGGSKLNIGGNTVWRGSDPDITGPSGCISSGCGGEPLPVELLGFSVVRCSENEVCFNWSTATETNNDFFLISSSSDLMNWKEISQIDGIGNSTFRTDYKFSIPTEQIEDVGYFRLEQRDRDGEHEILSIQQLSLEILVNKVELTMNPSIEVIKVALNPQENYEISLFDIRDYYSKQVSHISGTLHIGFLKSRHIPRSCE